MIKIGKDCWIVYNKNGVLVTIDVCHRDIDRYCKLKGYEKMSILDNEYDNSEYSLLWDIWDNKYYLTNEQIKQNIDKKLNLKDYITLKYKTSIFYRKYAQYLVVGGKFFEYSHNQQVFDLIYNTICSHFDKSAKCSQHPYRSGYIYCTREQAKQVLATFKQMEDNQNIEEARIK